MKNLDFSDKDKNKIIKNSKIKILVSTERSCHYRNTHVKYQNSSTHCSKVIYLAGLMFQTELQNDRQDKNNIPPLIFDLEGIKIKIYFRTVSDGVI